MAARQRDYVFTIHGGNFGNRTEMEVIERLKGTNCTYIVFQQETGGSLGRDHIQGYVMFKLQKTLAAAQEALGFPSCHMEMRKANNVSDAINYCKKSETKRPGCEFIEIGAMPMDSGKKRTLMDAIGIAKEQGYKRAMLDLPEVTIRYAKGLKEYAHIAAGDRIPQQRRVNVYYVWGDSGCGKSWWANTLFDTPTNTYTTYDMPEKIWMGNYAGERTLVIEEFKSLCNDSLLKCMLEGYKMEFQNKGGFVWSEWDTVILTSNTDPRLAYDPQINWWSVLPTPPGPFQRRFATGGIIHGTGNYEMGTSAFDVELPIRESREAEQPYEPMPDIEPRVAPDSGAAPDEPVTTDVPGVTFEPTTPQIISLLDTLDVDDFLTF